MKKRTREQLIATLEEKGYRTKTDQFGNVLIKGYHGIDAYFQETEDGKWTPLVNIKWVNLYVLVPALAASMILATMDIKGFLAMVGCAFLGLGAGTAVLRPKQAKLKEALEKIG